jgi:hypothetical protein
MLSEFAVGTFVIALTYPGAHGRWPAEEQVTYLDLVQKDHRPFSIYGHIWTSST